MLKHTKTLSPARGWNSKAKSPSSVLAIVLYKTIPALAKQVCFFKSNTRFRSSNLFDRGEIHRGRMIFQRKNFLMDRIKDRFGVREVLLFPFICRCDKVSRADNDRRCIQFVKGEFRDVGSDIAHNGTAFIAVSDDDELACLANRRKHRCVIKRNKGACVDDLCGNTVFFFQDRRSFHCVIQRSANGEDGQICTFLFDVCLSEGECIILGRNAFLAEAFTDIIDAFVFKKKNGVVGFERSGEHTLHVIRSNGIDLRTLKSGNPVFQLWEHKLDAPESVLAERVTDILQTQDGTIWVGSNGYGFYRSIREENGKYSFKAYTTNDGLASNSVRGLEEDKEGRIWITTTNGLSRFDPETSTFYNYTKKDGLLSNQFYWNATSKSANGDIYLGSINGLSVIKALITDEKPKMAPIAFTHLRVADREVDSQVNVITMHERDKYISIEFAALDYNASKLSAYSYRLKGFDNEWKKVSTIRRLATYTNLQAGNYTFELRYAPDGTQWQEEVATLNIHVEPYFYKTIGFNLLLLLLIMLVAYLLITRRIRSFQEQRRLLHIKVEERTRELKEQKHVLEQRSNELYSQNELLKQQNVKILEQQSQIIEMSNKVQELTVDKLAFFTNITHEFRTPLTLIIGPIERALKLSYNPQVIEQLHFVERNSKYLLSLVNQLMDFRKIESGKMEISPNPNNFKKFIEEMLLPFEAYARERQITLKTFIRLPQQYMMYDEDAMQKVLINLLGNAMKFTPEGGVVCLYATTLQTGG